MQTLFYVLFSFKWRQRYGRRPRIASSLDSIEQPISHNCSSLLSCEHNELHVPLYRGLASSSIQATGVFTSLYLPQSLSFLEKPFPCCLYYRTPSLTSLVWAQDMNITKTNVKYCSYIIRADVNKPHSSFKVKSNYYEKTCLFLNLHNKDASLCERTRINWTLIWKHPLSTEGKLWVTDRNICNFNDLFFKERNSYLPRFIKVQHKHTHAHTHAHAHMHAHTHTYILYT